MVRGTHLPLAIKELNGENKTYKKCANGHHMIGAYFWEGIGSMGAVIKRAFGQRVKALLLVLTLFGVMLPGVSQAKKAYFLYQLPDGSRMITDYRVQNKSYKLVRASRKLSKLSKQATRRYDPNRPANIDEFEKIIRNTADRYDVDVALVKAVIHTESYFNPHATSHKGASGLMQLMPKTAAQYGISDIYNPRQNIEAGVKHLRYLLVKYNHKIPFVLAAYNAGEEAVKKYAGIPPYRETQKYVTKVLKYRGYYQTWN